MPDLVRAPKAFGQGGGELVVGVGDDGDAHGGCGRGNVAVWMQEERPFPRCADSGEDAACDARIHRLFPRHRMRPFLPLLVLVVALLLGGCIHSVKPLPPPPATGAAVLPQRMLHLYVDCVLPAESPEVNRALATTIALTLRDQLRLRGYDVRGAESTVRNGAAPSAAGEAIAQLSHLAAAVAAGTAPPATDRYATYLHPNAPRLLLFVALALGDSSTPHRPAELQLGGLLADSATGEIRWSGRLTARSASDEQSVRRLAGQLLRTFGQQSPK